MPFPATHVSPFLLSVDLSKHPRLSMGPDDTYDRCQTLSQCAAHSGLQILAKGRCLGSRGTLTGSLNRLALLNLAAWRGCFRAVTVALCKFSAESFRDPVELL